LNFPSASIKQEDCTTNILKPVFELDYEGLPKIKWCPGFGDKWKWNLNRGGAMVDGKLQTTGIWGRVSDFMKSLPADDPRKDTQVMTMNQLSSSEM